MSYGHANLRDIRRKSAMERLEKTIKSYAGQADKKQKLDRAKETLDNTQKNLGKGSRQLQGEVT